MLALVAIIIGTFLQGQRVEAHFQAFKAHFDNPPECGPLSLKSDNGTVIEVARGAGKSPCITRTSYSSTDKTCSGVEVDVVTLIADEDCWRVPDTDEYYKINCDTDSTIKGRMLCNKGCEECIETNFRTGYSDSFLAIVERMSNFTGGHNGFQSIPVDGTCITFGTSGDWDDGNGGTAVAIDYKFEGTCVSNKYEGAFDNPDHPLFLFLHKESTPTTMIIVGIVLCVLLGGIYIILGTWCEVHANGTMVVLEILVLLGAAILFLGLFVLDGLSSLLAGFLALIATVLFQVLWKWSGLCKKVAADDEDDDGDLHDNSGSVTYTQYMDFGKPLAKLNVLLASQFFLVVLLSTEMFNYWGDEGAEYDKDITSLEARNLLFFIVAVLMQPVQYDALFGDGGSRWTQFYDIISPDAGVCIQVWTEEFHHERGNEGKWKNLDVKKHPRWERFIRWILMAVGGFLIPTIMLIFTPVLLTFSSTALDFVLNATALSFIGSMDNGDAIRFRITDDLKRIAAGKNNDDEEDEETQNGTARPDAHVVENEAYDEESGATGRPSITAQNMP